MSVARPSGPHRFTLSREAGLFLLLVLILVLFRILYPVSWAKFATFDNFASVVRNMAFEGILAMGMMLIMVGGAFDLSVGATASMVGVVTGWLMKEAGWPVPVAVVSGLALGALSGVTNGVLVAKVRVNALITTLGTMGIFSGIALLIGGPGITFLPPSFSRLGQAQYLGLQTPVWLVAILAVVGHYALAHTRYFRQFYYVGLEPESGAPQRPERRTAADCRFHADGTACGTCGDRLRGASRHREQHRGDGKGTRCHYRLHSWRGELAGWTRHRVGRVARRLLRGARPKHAPHQTGSPRMAGDYPRVRARFRSNRGCRVEPEAEPVKEPRRKSEIRNPKQIQTSDVKTSKTLTVEKIPNPKQIH